MLLFYCVLIFSCVRDGRFCVERWVDHIQNEPSGEGKTGAANSEYSESPVRRHKTVSLHDRCMQNNVVGVKCQILVIFTEIQGVDKHCTC